MPTQPEHLPIAAYVPETHKAQRYFSRNNGSLGLCVQGGATSRETRTHARAGLTVMRFAEDDHAQVELRLSAGRHSSTSYLACSAQELRDIALRLLDAAHDLDTHPAAKLIGESGEA